MQLVYIFRKNHKVDTNNSSHLANLKKVTDFRIEIMCTFKKWKYGGEVAYHISFRAQKSKINTYKIAS